MKKALIPNTTQIQFSFKDDVAPIIFDYAKASDANRDYAEVHGWLARIGDCAAGAKTEADRATAIQLLVNHYEQGSIDWNTKSTKAVPQNAVILRIAGKLGITYEQAEIRVQEEMLKDLESA